MWRRTMNGSIVDGWTYEKKRAALGLLVDLEAFLRRVSREHRPGPREIVRQLHQADRLRRLLRSV